MKIALISNFVYPYRIDPTGKIAYTLAKNLAKKGHNVTVFSKCVSIKKIRNDKIESVNYCGIRSIISVTGRDFKTIIKNNNFFSKFILWIFFLFTYILRKINEKRFNEHEKFINKINKINNDLKYDLLIIFAGDFELIDIVKRKIIKAKKNILYATDDWTLFTNNQKDFEMQINVLFDCIYAMEAVYNNVIIDKDKFRKLSPLFEIDKETQRFTNKSKRPLGAYFGTLGRERTSDLFFNKIEKLTEQNDFIFYTSDIEQLNQIKKQEIQISGYVAKKEYQSALAKADFLIILDNHGKYRNFIPSKIYEYIGTRKPILFFYYEENSLGYKVMQPYDLVLFINLNKKNDTDSLNYFIENNFRKNSKKGLYDIYPDCSPEIFINKMIGDL